ncbi:MAG: chemotaxis protein CheW [Rhodocyclaceae bacterium]|nr:chemotaxis protein CheW [Rhodocyclaceae bacterium]
MSIDMTQFYQVFFEEAGEHLASMETLLLGLDLDSPDVEQLNAIFRAAHSIKGSAGTFGFTDLTEVTHILENLLDRIRKGELAIREEMIDAFLDAGDVLKDLVAAHKGEGEADPATVAATCARLKELTASTTPVVVAPPPIPLPTSPLKGEETWLPPLQGEGRGGDGVASHATGFDLRFLLEGSPSETEEAVTNLLSELSDLGTVHIVARPTEAEQPWHLALHGASDEQVIRDVLEFIVRSDSIRIAPLGKSPTNAAEGAYGFFGTEAAEPPLQEAGFGLFAEEALPTATPAVTQDNGYGFFDEPPSPVSIPATVKNESYGFFEPQASPPPPTASSPTKTEEGYGFFGDPPSPSVPVAVAEVLAPVPAPIAPPAPTALQSLPVSPPPAASDRRNKSRAEPAETTIRVDVDKVDQLINLIGELVITQAMLIQSAEQVDPVAFERLHNGLSQLERNSRDLQESVMSIRMMPVSVVFSRFPRVVRDLSQKLGKQVELKMIGGDTEMDKSLIERIADPLTHLIRNSLDHGLEMPEVRAAKGKQPMGTITLKAYHQSGNIVIEVGDDGAGLPRQKILSKAKERGFPVSDQMPDAEVWMLIFEAGFSTADQVTEVSGRGVGMDVVKRNITAMGGRVEIESMVGVGTRMTVRLPLTLAILDGMSVACGAETYIIPLGYVLESVQVEPGMIKSVSGVERLLRMRDEYLPIVVLSDLFGISGAATAFDLGIMIILESGGSKIALFVDAMIGQHQVVIKSLETNYRKVSGVSGATIMGDGHVALILDVATLIGMAKSLTHSAAV